LVSFLRSRRFGYPQIQRRITSQNAKLTPEALSSVRVGYPLKAGHGYTTMVSGL